MILISPVVVPASKEEAFMEIADRPQGSYAGFERLFVCRGEEYLIDARHDLALHSLGLVNFSEMSL